jgi:hypothetical protein
MTPNKEIWNELHRLQNAACKTGKASAEVAGVGFVEIECERVYVMRSRGDSTRKSLTRRINGKTVSSRELWKHSGSCE